LLNIIKFELHKFPHNHLVIKTTALFFKYFSEQAILNEIRENNNVLIPFLSHV